MISQTVLALRGSGGCSLGTGWSVAGLCGSSAAAHFCCYFTYFVHVTFTILQRNDPFFQICCKLHYKINVFHLRWSLVHLGHISGFLGWYSDDIWLIFWPKMTNNYQKYNFCKMRMSQNSKNVDFSETKAPQGASRQIGASQNQKMKI